MRKADSEIIDYKEVMKELSMKHNEDVRMVGNTYYKINILYLTLIFRGIKIKEYRYGNLNR